MSTTSGSGSKESEEMSLFKSESFYEKSFVRQRLTTDTNQTKNKMLSGDINKAICLDELNGEELRCIQSLVYGSIIA